MLQKSSNTAQTDPEKVLSMISDIPRQFFPLKFGVGAAKFLSSAKWYSKKCRIGIKNLPKPKRLNQKGSNTA